MIQLICTIRRTITLAGIMVLFVCISSNVWGHTVWEQRNEPGPWTICLYHCDDEDLSDGLHLVNAGWNETLDLKIGFSDENSIESNHDVKHGFLNRSITGYSQQSCISRGVTAHPTGDLSIEFWLKFAEYGAEIEIGFQKGVSLHVRIGGDGDRFQLLGSGSFDDDGKYSAPGFESFPPVGDWHHIGVAIHAPVIEELDNETFSYQDGCYAEFFYDSHIVGFTDETKRDLSGLTFTSHSEVAILIHHGTIIFDEIMISDVDWTDPIGHGGSGHGGIRVGHAFEDGRQPSTDVYEWSLF